MPCVFPLAVHQKTRSAKGGIPPFCAFLHFARCLIRCRGYTYDGETGFYYLNSRYYDPEIGRFLNGDAYVSTGQGLTGYNMYVYCGNNPVNRVDYGGKFWDIAGFFAAVCERILFALAESFEFKVTIGGVGVSAEIEQYDTNVGVSYNPITLGVDNGDSYTAITSEVSIEVVGNGYSWETEHRYETNLVSNWDGHDTTSAPWEVLACEKTEHHHVISFAGVDIDATNGEVSYFSGTGWGFCGWSISIGFDAFEFLQVLFTGEDI